ncbi:N-acetylmuramoyl-L-alanine amidase [Candidatus Arthromitus sp. SFB-mouse-NL]|uniref:N-acetylmuramoyl-L-alanine amidase n=1 Tax=Candidatus Arthromitus sp. SFB-mouse-NL TaxID=1508644 RepID=UPI0005A6D67E|nr:N-acetylmuramoyl-L-alanine amidase [Candidatus Arthromitus sp. SFB-mouse-NL]
MKINEKLVKYNFSSRKGEKIKYITIHDTGNPDRGADAEAHFKLHDRADRGASAHYFVDDKQILRIIRDEDKSWHCGDGHGKYGITNENSIGIEMCINSDGDFNKTYQNTLDLVKHLMDKYNISIDKVVRHYDASRKSCPNSWATNNWDRWDKFKSDLQVKKDYTTNINLVYKNLFQREGDSEGINYWNDKLNSGLSFGDMLKAMGESEEFRELYLIVN